MIMSSFDMLNVVMILYEITLAYNSFWSLIDKNNANKISNNIFESLHFTTATI